MYNMSIDKIVTQTLSNLTVPSCQLFWQDEKNKPKQYITWVEVTRKPYANADDKEVCEVYHISVDIFSKYGVSYSDLIERIESVMLESGFIKTTYSTSRYEDETGYVHKPLGFKYYKQK